MTKECMIEMEIPEVIDKKFWEDLEKLTKTYGLGYEVKTIDLSK